MSSFLQIDEPLARTNARYRQDPLFTLVNFDMEAITHSGKLDAFEGFEMDLQEPIRFVFE